MITLTLRDVMTAAPVTVSPEDPIGEARRAMLVHGVRHLPVCEGGTVVGVVSQRDLDFVRGVRDELVEPLRVADAMSAFPFVAGPDAEVEDVARTMADAKYGSVVVVEEGKPVGVFTMVDGMALLAALLHDGMFMPPVRAAG
ncbi:MAG TPA: CBS domain-containing protein [Minicystis sp.]|nr:CBS domain-containing protein [Minicystis sp.]